MNATMRGVRDVDPRIVAADGAVSSSGCEGRIVSAAPKSEALNKIAPLALFRTAARVFLLKALRRARALNTRSLIGDSSRISALERGFDEPILRRLLS
jgi:hypothetical protein